MNDMYIPYFNKVIEYEEKGAIDAALLLMDKLIQIDGDEVELKIEKAKLEYRNKYYKEALIDFIEIYSETKSEEIYDLILEAYYYPNEDDIRIVYQNNLRQLQKYNHYINELQNEELIIHPIWYDDKNVIFLNDEKHFLVNITLDKEKYKDKKVETDIVPLICNELYQSNIIEASNKFIISNKVLDKDIPIYIYWEKEMFQLYMQINDIMELILTKRIIFIVGENALYRYFLREDVIIPSKIIFCQKTNNVIETLDRACAERERRDKEWQREIDEYYSHSEELIKEHIRQGKPKILFITSRFTTVMQYHTRDLKDAAERLGCETYVLIEKDGLHYTEYSVQHMMAEFKPDIVLVINHFRFEWRLPEQVCFITWVQDPLPYIMDRETPGKLLDMDFVMNHYTTWRDFRELEYPVDKIIEAPIPANDQIYKPYVLTQYEKEKYECDICFVCHASDVQVQVQYVLEALPQVCEEMILVLYNGYYEYVFETGNFFYEKEEYEEYINGVMREAFRIKLSEEFVKQIAEDMYRYYNPRVFRQILVDWIIEAGYTNIKLWGNGWKTTPKYEKYAMGPAQNGENLSKIYQASKIIIGNNIMTTGAARAWETMLSGGFYMSNYIPPKSDGVDIRKILAEDEVVIFKGKDDLINKIDYYLSNKEERQKMIYKGRNASLNKMTFDKLMERTLRTVAERI